MPATTPAAKAGHTTSQRRARPVGGVSPFRSTDDDKRFRHALAQVQKRDAEIAKLERVLAGQLPDKARKLLQVRLSASVKNLQSWLDYLGDAAPREPRAVVTV